MPRHQTTLRLAPETAARVERYRARILAPTFNAAVNALIARALDVVEQEQIPAVAAPHQRGPR